MKQGKILAVGLLLLAFALFFMMRPVREKACPLSKKVLAADIQGRCTEFGGVVNKEGRCVCPGDEGL